MRRFSTVDGRNARTQRVGIAAGALTLFVLPALVMFVEGRRET